MVYQHKLNKYKKLQNKIMHKLCSEYLVENNVVFYTVVIEMR